ncbi:MAG: pyridoxal-phosphate dependent enzyme [Actinomycetia bacterium]|nr:pyridoxal-phosphate dependent enzyme [Actinomycetes bacterium]
MTDSHVSVALVTPGQRPYPLFSAYPRLAGALPRAPLGLWPTAVDEAPHLAAAIGAGSLYVKRDDLSALPFGGNKVRKLEIVLGDALARGSRQLITFGAAGSNHALATAIYGTALGFEVTSILTPQPNASYVRRNLLGHLAVGASVRMCADRDSAMRDAAELSTTIRERGEAEPYFIPFGGTTPMSTAGFVNAGFELAEQVAEGSLPEPDVVYVALGSMGTAAGIALGLALAGVRPLVRAVSVVPDTMAGERAFRELLASSAGTLRAGDPSIPPELASRVRVEIVEGFLGEGYACFTPRGMEAVRLAAAEEDLVLDGTYTGKTMSALIADARSGALEGQTVLFWDTYNSRDIATLTAGVDYRALPEEARVFFETGVQPLDGEGN